MGMFDWLWGEEQPAEDFEPRPLFGPGSAIEEEKQDASKPVVPTVQPVDIPETGEDRALSLHNLFNDIVVTPVKLAGKALIKPAAYASAGALKELDDETRAMVQAAGKSLVEHPQALLPTAGEYVGGILYGLPGALGGAAAGQLLQSVIDRKMPRPLDVVENLMLAPLGYGAVASPTRGKIMKDARALVEAGEEPSLIGEKLLKQSDNQDLIRPTINRRELQPQGEQIADDLLNHINDVVKQQRAEKAAKYQETIDRPLVEPSLLNKVDELEQAGPQAEPLAELFGIHPRQDALEQLALRKEKRATAERGLAHMQEEDTRLAAANQRLDVDPEFSNLKEDIQQFSRKNALRKAGGEDLEDLNVNAIADTGLGKGVSHLVADNPLSKYIIAPLIERGLGPTGFRKNLEEMGMFPAMWDPQRILSKSGGEAEKLALDAHESDLLSHMLGDYFDKKGLEVFDKHGITADDHGVLDILHTTPEFYDLAMANPTAKTKDLLDTFEQTTGKHIEIDPKDYERLDRARKWTQAWHDQVTDPLIAVLRRLDPEQKTMEGFNTRMLLPTFTHAREANELDWQIQHLQQGLARLAPESRAGDAGAMLQNQIAGLERKRGVAMRAADETEKNVREALRMSEQFGIIPNKLTNPSFKMKHTDIGFDLDVRGSARDYIRGLVNKAVYDQYLPRMHEYIANTKDPRLQRYMTAYTQDQLGKRKQVGLQRLRDNLTRFTNEKVADKAIQSLDTVSAWNGLSNIGLNMKFPLLQQGQLLTNVLPVVKEEAFNHGMAQAMLNPEAWEKAKRAGVISSGLSAAWADETLGPKGQRMIKWMRDANRLPEVSENFNRVATYNAALYQAEKKGLRGKAARDRAVDTTLFTNFGYTPAHRATAAGTLTGNLMMRYRSYSLKYGNMLAKLIDNGDVGAAAQSLATAMALSGTSGIPLYGLAQGVLARRGIAAPQVTPFEETTGIGMGGSANPIPTLPELDWTLAGPIIGPPVAVAHGVVTGDSEEFTKGAKGVLGSAASHLLSGTDELLRGGETKTPTGRLKMRRETPDVVKSMFNLGPTARATYARERADISNALEAHDYTSLTSRLAHARNAGIVDLKSLVSESKAALTRKDRESWFDDLLGR